MKPSLGRIVIYESRNGDGIESPAIVLRTQDTTDPDLIERWGNSLSGTPKPPDLTPDLPTEDHVDLLVHGLGGDYREYNVERGFGPRTWHFHDDTPQTIPSQENP